MDDFYTTIKRNNKEFDLRVLYEYSKSNRGLFDYLNGRRNCGPQLTPDEPAEVNILNTFNRKNKSEFELTRSEEESIIDKIIEEKENECGDYETDDY